jgi:hypothetical protein
MSKLSCIASLEYHRLSSSSISEASNPVSETSNAPASARQFSQSIGACADFTMAGAFYKAFFPGKKVRQDLITKRQKFV